MGSRKGFAVKVSLRRSHTTASNLQRLVEIIPFRLVFGEMVSPWTSLEHYT